MQSKRGIIFLMILLPMMVLVSDDKAQPQQSQSDRLRGDLKAPDLTPKKLPEVPEVKEPKTPVAQPVTPDTSVALGSVTGKLIREIAIGGETSGWAVLSNGYLY